MNDYLLSDVLPHPLTIAVSPANVLEASEWLGKVIGLMFSENHKTYFDA
jgi:hypothetical protein